MKTMTYVGVRHKIYDTASTRKKGEAILKKAKKSAWYNDPKYPSKSGVVVYIADKYYVLIWRGRYGHLEM